MRLLETINIKDGIIQNILYHNQRFNKSRRTFWPHSTPLDLYEYIVIPDEFKSNTVRCRIIYGELIEEIQFHIYQYRNIKSLKLVETDIEYSHKYEDRSAITKLVSQNPNFDDILMVKNGYITDTSYANIILKRDNEFYTPKKPLLAGTKRQYLLDEDIIIEKNIRPSDLKKYSHFAIINAFNDLDLVKFISIQNIQR